MTPAKSKAQELRLLIDSLEETAFLAAGVVKDLPEMAGRAGELLPKTPDGIRSLSGVLRKSYVLAKEDYNSPTNDELRELQTLEPAKRALHDARVLLVKAGEAFNKVSKDHVHRILLVDPKTSPTGKATYPQHPKCLVCDEILRQEWFCIRSPLLRCLYPNVIGKADVTVVLGTDLEQAKHDGDIECVHCEETWVRVE